MDSRFCRKVKIIFMVGLLHFLSKRTVAPLSVAKVEQNCVKARLDAQVEPSSKKEKKLVGTPNNSKA